MLSTTLSNTRMDTFTYICICIVCVPLNKDGNKTISIYTMVEKRKNKLLSSSTVIKVKQYTYVKIIKKRINERRE